MHFPSSVRLVRACGSKLKNAGLQNQEALGQARKSLWIETIPKKLYSASHVGQARKSLWIETFWR